MFAAAAASWAVVLAGSLAGLGAAQYPPKPEGVTVIQSKFHEGISISFKEPGICETTPGVKSYAGHVHLPPGFLNDVDGGPQDYPVNTFFWFFEARKDPANAPLAIWLNGGPGASSMMGLLQENGPCFVTPDSKSTVLNPWSWNNEVNMLYIDEPNQVGFSYDVPTNCSVSLTAGGFGRLACDGGDNNDAHLPTTPQLNLTSYVGTFSSQKTCNTANGTAQAAHALWHFAQTFFTEFPHYKPTDDRISLWAESYGGHYGPAFMRFFQQQNEKIADGTIADENAHYLHLDTLGIVNGYLDALVQMEASISFPYNNTYGVQVFNQSIHDELMLNFTKPHGCKDQMTLCQAKLKSFDVATINSGRINSRVLADLCDHMEPQCENPAEMLFLKTATTAAWMDITHPFNDPFPPPYVHGYLTQSHVLAALGSPVNFTVSSPAVSRIFASTRDDVHGGFLDATAYLLDHGVKVHMMFGDRDYACNWVGGEAASLAVPYSRAEDFANAGYAPLLAGAGDVGDSALRGLTRQFGNYSFSRVFQAGHMIPSYEPEAAYAVFMRATFNRDIATGLLPVSDKLATEGPSSTWHMMSEMPIVPEPRCYILSPGSCVSQLWRKVEKGAVTVKDWFVVDVDDDNAQMSEEL